MASLFEGGALTLDAFAAAEIAARAMTLDERLELDPAPPARDAGAPRDPRMAAWARMVAGASGDGFARRLAWDGLEEERISATLVRPVAFAGGGLPGWISTFASYLARASDRSGRDTPPGPEPAGTTGPVPVFPELWMPLVREARQRLAARAGRELDSFAPAALSTLESLLLLQAASVAGPSVFEEFAARRKTLQRLAPGLTGGAAGTYATFVEALLSGGLLGFFREHAVLARQLAILLETWVDSTAELARRLSDDRAALSEVFGAHGPVIEVRPSLSDRHGGGRTVSILRFASGASVVYKPRDPGVEAAWNRFLRAWRPGDPSLRLPSVTSIERAGYGYFELIDTGNLEDENAARSYVRRSGALLCLAWLLGLDDLHVENVIGSADGPVVVDAESALQPEFASSVESGSGAVARFARGWRESALRSGLLTTARVGPTGTAAEISGLRGGVLPPSAPRAAWSQPNTDAMERGFAAPAAPEPANLPRFSGRPLLPDDFPEDFASGFSGAYRALIANRGAVSAALEAFAGTSTRIVLRPSETYARLLLELSAPGHLRDGVSRSFAIDSVNRVFREGAEPPALWPLVREERAALENLDVPYFRVGVQDLEVPVAGTAPIAGRIARTGSDAVRVRLDGLSEADLAAQLARLRPRLDAERRRPASDPGFSNDELMGLASSLGHEVRDILAASAGGEKRWENDSSLYSGSAGIAIFFAALASAARDPSFLESARDLCGGLAQRLDADAEDAGQALTGATPGTGDGAGTLLYGLATTAAISHDAGFLELARRAASQFTPARIAASRLSDVEGGIAGAALGLLSFHRLTSDPQALSAAAACGDALLARAVPIEGGLGWRSEAASGACLAGFAHGTAGIALALTRLSAAGAGDGHRFAAAAARARRYEESLFDAAHRNWPVLAMERDRPPVFLSAWCHGAPGIALSRAAIFEASPDAAVERERDRAMAAAAATGFLSTDHLCCGNAGIAEILLAAGEIAACGDWRRAGRRRLGGLLHAAIPRGSFRLENEQSEGLSDPGFFRGLSGLGYTLLRYAVPGSLPSVLMFEEWPRNPRRLDADRGPMLRFDQSIH
ncbi:MAG: type 2 lanthipeptide synthetase LanM family protein [Acidobacteriota bacterium]